MDVSVADPLVGQLLDGRYAVRSRIAKGGMATVYLALDERLDREVAVKVMSPALVDDEDFVRRFTREARSAARLNHHGIVQVFDQGTDGDIVFLAMEYVPGRTLRDLMRERGPLSAGEAFDLMEPVLEALAAAHRAGIVHRDVKPENVLIADDGRVKVADFGLARAVDAGTAHSQTGLLLGTVSYLAPEQVERGVADARSDVYAAGVVLFELLTGGKPFVGDTAVQVALQHVSSRVPAPSTRIDNLDPALDDLVLLAAARNPDDRPADARELLMVVRETRRRLPQEALDAEPTPAATTAPQALVVALPPEPHDDPHGRTVALRRSPAEPVVADARPRRRHRGRTSALVVLLLAVLLGAGGWYLGAGPGAYEDVPKVVGSTQAEAQASLSRHGLSARLTQGYSERVPVGSVVSSDPGEGQRVRKNGTVTLVVSQGPERHAVPKLVGTSEDAARGALADASLKVGKVTRAFDTGVPEGSVISASQPAGTELRARTSVDLVVSKGPEPVAVASWVGKPASDATQALTSSGLKVKASQAFDDTVAKGLVISQKPGAGTAYKGQQVTLVVSKGPQLVDVPRVVGRQLEDAARELQKAGFQVEVHKILGGFFGTVRSQNPGAGQQAPKGSTIRLTVV
ncbi:Stk1 family PASTA domain-containing Ser/Thr kinase [Angustibacter sp. McL0619]|uniref:Stk1 family PASTA domain-containing Ser/Thr kinase n=1 Tax=Angustibacter sp. McL0619 TaxID=3415676 RepID=UPI003CE8C1C5